MRIHRNTKKGFTLIELMVSMTLFSIVMLVAISTLLAIVDANKKAQTLKSVMNNLNFALESMSREIRVGTKYHCQSAALASPTNSQIVIPQDCLGAGGKFLAFERGRGSSSDNSDQMVYRYYVDPTTGNGSIQRSLDSGATYTNITAPEVQIEDLTFYVVGAPDFFSGDTIQPRVVISIRGVAGDTVDVQTEFTVQASVSQRLIDF